MFIVHRSIDANSFHLISPWAYPVVMMLELKITYYIILIYLQNIWNINRMHNLVTYVVKTAKQLWCYAFQNVVHKMFKNRQKMKILSIRYYSLYSEWLITLSVQINGSSIRY